MKQQELEATSLDQVGLYEKFAHVDRRPDSRRIVQLEFHNLPGETDSEKIKNISGAKHVIGATAAVDNIKNECVGTGNLQVRLGEGETEE